MTRRKVLSFLALTPFVPQMAHMWEGATRSAAVVARNYLSYHRLPPEIGWRGYFTDSAGRFVGVQHVNVSVMRAENGISYHWLPRGMGWLGYWTDTSGVTLAWERWDDAVIPVSPAFSISSLPFLRFSAARTRFFAV